MRSSTFRASRTVSAKGVTPAVKEQVTKVVDIPETISDLSTMEDAYGKTLLTVTVGYNGSERDRQELPFWVAMAIEGYKLYVGKQIAPEAEDEIDAELEEYLASRNEKVAQNALQMLSFASKAKKAAVREAILSGMFG